MTAVSALLLALITGWMVPAARLAMAAFLGPWLVALVYQTADIGLGYAVSPPQTVTQFPRVIGYVVVTAAILALGLILSALIGERRSRVVPVAGRQTAREMVKRAAMAGTVVVAALIVLDIADHAVLVWPESTAHHTTNPILAANALATALCPFSAPGRNAILHAFTEPEMRELRPDWDAMTARAVPHLRSIVGADTGDPRLVELVGELSLRSERFRTLWARQDVKQRTTGTSLFNHPQVGPLELNYERLLIAGSGMQALVTYHAQPGSDSEERLRLLASITTTGSDAPVRPRPARPHTPTPDH